MKIMKKLVSTILISLLASTAFAVDVNRTIDADANGHVEVSNISGEITIEGWNQSKVEVTGTIGRDVKELIVERDGDEVVVSLSAGRTTYFKIVLATGTEAGLAAKLLKPGGKLLRT